MTRRKAAWLAAVLAAGAVAAAGACSGGDEGEAQNPGGGGSAAAGGDSDAGGSGGEAGDAPFGFDQQSDGGETCAGGCPEGQVCSHGKCVTQTSCKTDDDCKNDTYCDPVAGCVPWGSPPDNKTNDPNCVYVVSPGNFSPTVKCEFSKPPPGDPFPKHTDVQATPVVVNFNKPASAGPPSIVAGFTATVPASYTENLGVIRVLRGTDCSLEANLGGVDVDADGKVDWMRSASPLAVGDLDGDGVAEIVAYGGDETTLAFTRKQGQWSLLWKAKTAPNGPNFVATIGGQWAGPSIHDLDDDGKPEVIREGWVISSAGVLLSQLPTGYATYSQGLNSVLANLDQDPAIELTNGAAVWEWSGGAWKKEAYFPGAAQTGPGFVAVADFGAYGNGLPPTNPEIAVARNSTVAIWAADGATALAPTPVPGGGGGNLTVADYDGDGLPELGIAGKDFYTVYDIDCTAAPRPNGKCGAKNQCDDATGTPGPCPSGILWSRKTQDYSSNITGSSVFDFEADGKAEVVYADECFVRVYRGTDGEVLFSQYRSSCTWYENPIVADVDGNFRADLVVPSNLACSDGVSGMACNFLDAAGVDKQFAGLKCKDANDCVSGTCTAGFCRCAKTAECCSAKDDAKCLEYGTKCAPPPPAVGGANTCRAAHPHGVSGIRVYSDALDKWVRSRTIWSQHAYAVTHVNEDGTVPKTSAWKNNWTEPGLNNFRQNVPGTANGKATADMTSGPAPLACGSGGAVLTSAVCNRGSAPVGAGIEVGFYDGKTKVCSAKTTKALQPGECEKVSCTWKNAPTDPGSKKDITVVPNDDKALTECKSGNNEGYLTGVWCKPPS